MGPRPYITSQTAPYGGYIAHSYAYSEEVTQFTCIMVCTSAAGYGGQVLGVGNGAKGECYSPIGKCKPGRDDPTGIIWRTPSSSVVYTSIPYTPANTGDIWGIYACTLSSDNGDMSWYVNKTLDRSDAYTSGLSLIHI